MKKLFVLIIILALAGCSEKGASLSCNNTEVTNLAMDITRKELKDQFFKIFYRDAAGILTRDVADMTYVDFKALQTSSQEEKEFLKKIIDQTENTVACIKLSALRLKGINKTTGMVSCAAKLSCNEMDLNIFSRKEFNLDIGYTAQRTEEGKIYVEVSGLR